MIDGTGPIPGYRYRWNGEAVAYFPGVDSPAPRAWARAGRPYRQRMDDDPRPTHEDLPRPRRARRCAARPAGVWRLVW